MADLVITATSVLMGANGKPRQAIVGAVAIARGKAVYVNASGLLTLSQCDVAADASCGGIALNDAGPGQLCDYVYEDDDFTPGATLVFPGTYVVSTTQGGLAPVADLVSTNYVSYVLESKSTTKARLLPFNTGAQKA